MSEIIAIGDLQGCLESFDGLLEQLPPAVPLVFVGDIVNRGPDSLGTLRRVKALCVAGRARIVLGNHDLHLLAVAAGAGAMKRKDTIAPILQAPDAEALVNWLRRQPLLIDDEAIVFVHAGIPPEWSLETAKALAHEVESSLAGPNWKDYLQDMYGHDLFAPSLTGKPRMRGILNGFTRMRFLDSRGQMDFDVKEGIGAAPEGFIPWFEAPRLVKKTICFGHWSMLGLVLRPETVAIDTGCLWGGTLTAVRFPDRRLFQEPCPEWAAPGC